ALPPPSARADRRIRATGRSTNHAPSATASRPLRRSTTTARPPDEACPAMTIRPGNMCRSRPARNVPRANAGLLGGTGRPDPVGSAPPGCSARNPPGVRPPTPMVICARPAGYGLPSSYQLDFAVNLTRDSRRRSAAPAAGEAEQAQEQVDEVQVEREGAHDG